MINENGKVKESLSLENTMWAGTVLASGKILGLVIYTGRETRMAMNSRTPTTKSGKIDDEINTISIFLFIMMLALSILVMAFSKINWNL
jgi:phospholipid-translocating ATPase